MYQPQLPVVHLHAHTHARLSGLCWSAGYQSPHHETGECLDTVKCRYPSTQAYSRPTEHQNFSVH